MKRLLILMMLALCACGGPAIEDTGETSEALSGPAFVQVASSDPQSSPTSVAVKYAKAQVAGDLNVVAICFFNATSTISSVVDTKGNAYSVAAPLFRYAAGPASCAMYYAPHIVAAAANSNTVTVTFSPKVLDPDVRIAEYSGVTALDVSAAASGTTALASSGTATTTQAGDLIVGSDYLSSYTASAGTGFTSRVITSPDSDILEDEIAGAPSAYAATANTGGGWWIMQMAAFKAAATADAGAEGGSEAGVDGSLDGGAADAAVEASLDSGADADGEAGPEAGGGGDASAEDAALDAPSEAMAMADSSVDDAGSDGEGDGSSDATFDAGGEAGASVPTLVQHVSGSNLRSNAMASPYCYTLRLPAPAQAGNAIVVGVTWKGSATLHVTDEAGDTYATNESFLDTVDGQSVGVASAFGVAGGARVLSVCFSANPGGWVQPMASEWANVVGIDGAGAGASGAGTTTSASLTPTAGDRGFQVVYTPGGPPTSFAATAGGTLLSADIKDGFAGQYGASTMALGSAVHWATAAVLLQAGAAGSVPAGMRIVHLEHENLPVSSGGGGNNNYYPSPSLLQFPSSGNLLIAAIGGGCGCSEPASAISITDSAANAWTLTRTQRSAGPSGGATGDATTQIFFVGNATPGSLSLSVGWNQPQTDDETVMLYDVTGAAASPFDIAVSAPGENNGGDLPLPTITPAQAGELVIVATPWDFDTAGALLGGFIDTNLTSGETVSGPFPVDQNNGWGHAWSTGGSMSLAWEPEFTSNVEFGEYAAVLAAFRNAQ